MKIQPKKNHSRGITILELTIVILMLLSLVSILFIGVSGWKKGADRSKTLLVVRNIQQATRVHQNFSAAKPGDTDLSLGTSIFNSSGTAYIRTSAPGIPPKHPVSGESFTFHSGGKNVYPENGTLYVTSSGPAYLNFTADDAGVY
ncbi:MAG: type II secretion system protein [Verrucomicrobiota bacterium]